jgi:hypothetical protein
LLLFCGSLPVVGFFDYVLEKRKELKYIKIEDSEPSNTVSADLSPGIPVGSEDNPNSEVE